MASQINASNSGFGGVVTSGDSSGILQLQTAGTTAVTIDTSQNVGIGTTSPSSYGKFAVEGANQTNIITATVANTSFQTYVDGSVGEIRLKAVDTSGANNSKYMTFYIQPSGSAAVERMRIDSSGNLLFNSGYGSVATAYGCRAWVNFNGTGTVAIRASGNVTSITDNGTGDYTVNFTAAMPDANYNVTGTAPRNNANDTLILGPKGNASTYSTSAIRISALSDGGAMEDSPVVSVSIFR